eukprot:TRINITY_DN3456_c0_g1_i1.p1 TRINITY_DN3456_c0_g1~~TRINITY_DN3456_c0_g1_i1.p1  ORF type:complete len:273 (+),score=99.40 TRINITY_DN3456_c0_g1_i1:243-1061(+)
MNSVKNNPLLSDSFICNMQSHWLAIRKLNGEYWNLNSLLAEPQWLSSFYLSAFLDTLTAKGYTIFVVTGNLPNPVPNTSDKNWKRVNLKGNQQSKRVDREQDDLEEAIRASLADSHLNKVSRIEKTQEELDEDEELAEALALSRQSQSNQSVPVEKIERKVETDEEDEELAAAIALSNQIPAKEERKLESEPEKGEDTTEILFNLPDGSRLSRRFMRSAKVDDLYLFLKGERSELGTSFSIRTAVPPTSLPKDSVTLNQLGLVPNAKLIVQK